MAVSNKKSAYKNLGMLALAIVLGGLGVYFSQQFINDKINFYKAQASQTEEMIEVVVPVEDYPAGTVVYENLMALRELPIKYVDVNAITYATFAKAEGQKLSLPVERGKVLTWGHIQNGQSPTFSGKISEGLRALTFPVNEINSISGFLQPSDIIDLMLTYDKNGKQVTMPIMENLNIMATGVKTTIDKSGEALERYSTVTVHVTPFDAKRIILAQDMGKITATLRNPDDLVPSDGKTVTSDDVLGIKKPARRTVKRRREVTKPKGIQYIIGGV